MVAIKSAKLKKFFFDRLKVQQALDKATHKNLSKAGAYIMRTARGLIRKVGKKGLPSQPGKPPKSRTGLLRDRILFAYSPERRSVIVGPEALNQTFFSGDGKPVQGTVPGVLEYGGEIGVLEYFVESKNQWRPVRELPRRTSLKGTATRIRRVRIEARPYMGPALAKNEKKVAAFWRDSVRDAA